MPTACITGASSGIGAEYARQLAGRGFNLLLIARRQDRLRQLCAELADRHRVEADFIAADLTVPDDLERVTAELEARQDLVMLINNAGFGTTTRYAESDLNAELGMVDLHVKATMILTRAVLPGMIDRQRGDIINVSSVAAFLSGTTYSATKAYLNTFSEGLQVEVRAHGLRVQALCPGFTYSEFHDTPAYNTFSRDQIPQAMWHTAQDVVRYSLEQLRTRKVVVIPGWRYKLLAWTMIIGLRPAVKRLRDRFMRRNR
jgi:uncharacterized protein